jgi:integrase
LDGRISGLSTEEAGVCQNSAYNYEKTLRAALRKAVAEHIIKHDPAVSVPRIEVVETELIFLSAAELQQLADVKPADYVGTEVRRSFLFACQTGLRISDLETLTWWRIERSPLQIIKRQKKTKNPVYIPLNEVAEALITNGKTHGNEERVFNFLLKRKMLYRYLKRWGASAGLTKKVTWHTARRTFATLALENGVDIYTVSKLLGHKSIEQVAKYAKATDRLKRAAVAALPAIKI